MKLFYVECGVYCCIVSAKNLKNARRNVLRTYGTANVSLVRHAKKGNNILDSPSLRGEE